MFNVFDNEKIRFFFDFKPPLCIYIYTSKATHQSVIHNEYPCLFSLKTKPYFQRLCYQKTSF